jgi:hypothetical protein
MKNKILATLIAFGLVGSASADIKINDNLSIKGFIDGSYQSVDNDSTTHDAAELELDEVEIDFLFTTGAISAEVHLDSSLDGANTGDDNINIEQAHFSYSLDNGLKITVGRYGSSLGLEGQDPAGLYTYSRAYGDVFDPITGLSIGNNPFNFGDVDSQSYEGLAFNYDADKFSVGLSVHNKTTRATALEVANGDENDLDLELSFAFAPTDELTIGAGFAQVNGAVVGGAVPADIDAMNINATYTVGQLLLGGEWSQIDAGNVTDQDAYMLLLDYDVSKVLGVAVRYSQWDTTANNDADQITVAPNYSITDNLGAILEYSNLNDSHSGLDQDTIAVELTYTF